jgi:hypothetical protein
MTALPEDELRTGLRMKRAPLVGVEETENEWWIGTISISRHHAFWRSGHAHPLRRDARFYKQWFDLGGHRGWAVVFRPQDPPVPKVGDYFVGWVDANREADVDGWLTLLNGEIVARATASEIEQGPRT